MPWTGGAVLTGALAIAGVPLLNGFASEWLTLQALLGLGPPGRGRASRWPEALAAAALAATIGLGASAS